MLLSIRLTRGPVQDGLWLGEALLTDLQVVSWFAHMDPKDGQSYRPPLLRTLRHRRGPFPGQSHCQGATACRASGLLFQSSAQDFSKVYFMASNPCNTDS